MDRREFVWSCAAFAGMTCLPGCGTVERPEGMPELVPVKLTITQGGQPLAGANVRLFTKDLSLKWAVGGITDDRGVATMRTHGQFEGAPEGEYVVLVQKTEIQGGEDLGPEPTDPVEKMKWNDQRNASSKEFNLVDPKFGDVKSCDLTVKVAGATEANFDVGEAVHIELKKV